MISKIHFMYRIYPKRVTKYYEKKMSMLGKWDKDTVERFLLDRLISVILILLICLVLFHSKTIAIIAMIAGYFLIPYVEIDKKISKRIIELEDESIMFFEVLSLSIESGKDLISALTITCDSINSDLSNEFKKAVRDTKLGKSIKESLISLKKRIPSSALNRVITNIIECQSNGGNLVENLNFQVEYIRNSKIMRAKEKINKLPIQISVVSVLLVVPMILLLIVGPVIIRYFS